MGVRSDERCFASDRPAIATLAKIGAQGIFQGNAHRDLERQLNRGPLDDYIPVPWCSNVPLLDVRKRPRPQTIQMEYPIMLPHELLAFMYSKNRSEFNDFIIGSGPPSNFWTEVPLTDPRYVGHPTKAVGQKDMLIPLRIHGDGVPVGKGKKRTYDVASFSSMRSKPGTTWEACFSSQA